MEPEGRTGKQLSPDTRVRISDGVAHRHFPEELVVVNLRTGQYHGLNETAGRMLEALEEMGTVGAAAGVVAEESGEPLERVQGDLVTLCSGLLERGIIEIDAGGDAH
jgi:hypothetical protein